MRIKDFDKNSLDLLPFHAQSRRLVYRFKLQAAVLLRNRMNSTVGYTRSPLPIDLNLADWSFPGGKCLALSRGVVHFEIDSMVTLSQQLHPLQCLKQRRGYYILLWWWDWLAESVIFTPPLAVDCCVQFEENLVQNLFSHHCSDGKQEPICWQNT